MEKEQESQSKAQLGGRIPTRAEILKNQSNQRRYFDSGDYAMSKAGKKPEPGQEIGSEHPVPERIPHRSAMLAANSGSSSPVRRPSTLAQESNAVRVAASRQSPGNGDLDEEALK